MRQFTHASSSLRCYGVTVAFHSNCPEILERIGPGFIASSHYYSSSSPDLVYFLRREIVTGRYSVSLGSTPIVQTTDLGEFLEALRQHVERTIAVVAADYVFVHSGAVAWRGKAILFPGRSGSGKSTLVRELISSGAEYLSDEYAVLDASGLVHPFARPLSLRTSQGRAACAPDEFGAQVVTGPLSVAAILFLRYQPGGAFLPASPTPGWAMLELLSNVVAVRANAVKTMRIARLVTSSAAVVLSNRGEAAETLTDLLPLMAKMATTERKKTEHREGVHVSACQENRLDC